MKLTLGIALALFSTFVLAEPLQPACGSILALDDLSTEVAGVTRIEVKESLCINAKQFSSAVISNPEEWNIRSASNGFSIMTHKKAGQSLVALFEPGKVTGHPVMILATPGR